MNDLRTARQMGTAGPLGEAQLRILVRCWEGGNPQTGPALREQAWSRGTPHPLCAQATYLNARKFVEDRVNYYAAPPTEKLLPDINSVYGRRLGWGSFMARLTSISGLCEWKRMCRPSPIAGPYIGPQIRTLVLDLSGVLLHAEWSRNQGWKYWKRPGVEEFLKAANQLGWEVVVYTPSTQMFGDPLLDKIDPQRNLIFARLYK